MCNIHIDTLLVYALGAVCIAKSVPDCNVHKSGYRPLLSIDLRRSRQDPKDYVLGLIVGLQTLGSHQQTCNG